MGTSFATLQLHGLAREDLAPYLQPGDLLREQNAPWLGLVPADEPQHEAVQRLEKLAKRLTKGCETAAALVFFYFDDEWFLCEFIRGGRRKTSCRSSDSWVKLGKELNALFEDEAPGKALRYASRCFDLGEQVRLLEETVGTALYDIPEVEPRRVPRGDETLREIKAREAALRKRPNQYRLTELPREEWPESVRAKRQLYELLRPQWLQYDVSRLLYETGSTAFVIPQHPFQLAYTYTDEAHTDHLILYDGAGGEIADGSFPGAIALRCLWRAKDGAAVCLFAGVTRETVTESSWSRLGGREYVCCLAPDGSERWRFVPEMDKHQNLQHVFTSPDGVITLLASAINGQVKADGLIFQLDGETGRLLRSRRVPLEDGLFRLVAVEALGAFVYDSMSKEELVLLDGDLQETARWPQRGRGVYPMERNVCGSVLWNDSYSDRRAVELYDLKSGGYQEIRLEIPAFVLARLSDGRLLGVNEKQSLLTVFDPAGTVAARCSVPGMLSEVWQEADRICLVEMRSQDSYGFVSPETLDATSVHVWRLDRA